jgi:hypothetical protein
MTFGYDAVGNRKKRIDYEGASHSLAWRDLRADRQPDTVKWAGNLHKLQNYHSDT